LLNRNQSYPVKYMIFPGTVIANVGDSPRHNVVMPSFRAIFLNPSNVELNVFLCVSSTAHSAPTRLISPTFGPAMQYSALLFAKKTSRQQAVTPRFGGRVLNGCGEVEASFWMVVRGDWVG
jgi:hypothetical protein